MADTKLSALTQETVLFGTDILYFAKDTGGGTFASRGILVSNLINDAGPPSVNQLYSSSKIDTLISAVAAGVSVKDDVVAATGPGDGNVTLSGETTISLVATSNSRVLLTDQTDPTENGIWITDAGPWTRATDYDGNPGGEVSNGDTIYVNNGASSKNSFKYINTTQNPITVGVTALTYTEHRYYEFGAGAGQACEGNDSRLPTQDENDALVGTGIPSGANPYVTQDTFDARNGIAINQVAHGLAVADVIYNNAGTWTKAQADDEDTMGIAVVTAVAGVDDFTLATIGNVTIAGHGFTVGQYLFVSAGTAGLLTETEPTGFTQFSNPVAYVLDANTLLILPWRPSQAIPRYNDVRVLTVSAASYIVDDLDEVINVDATTGNKEVNLPTPSAAYDGFEITVKKIDASVNTVTVKSAAGDIEFVIGTTGKVISIQGESYTFYCDGVDWFIK